MGNRKRPFVELMAATGGDLALYLWKQKRLQVLIRKKDSTLQNTGPCKWLSEIMAVPLNCMAAYASLKLQ